MGVRSWSRRRAVVVGLVTAGLVLTAAAPPAASGESGPLTVTTTDLPAGVDWYDIDNRGRIVGMTGDPDQRIVVWRRGEVTDIGPYQPAARPDCAPIGWMCLLPGPRVPSINDRGTIATSIDGQAALWRDGAATRVGGDLESSWVVDLNERDQALVAGVIADRYVLGLWSRGTFTRIVEGPSVEPAAWIPHLSDGGHVFVTTLEPECRCVRAFLWLRGHRRDVGPISGVINRRGQIAGSSIDLASGESYNSYPVLWEEGHVTRLPTLGGDQTGIEGINDRGQIVGYSTVPGESGSRTVVWEDGEIVDIGGAIPNHDSPVGINERGQVLIRGSGDNGRGRAFLWDDGDLVVLPPDDNPWTSVEANGFNDRGEIYGMRSPTPLERSVATFWAVRRSG
jgi:probable HAF family extracellular repeat protein